MSEEPRKQRAQPVSEREHRRLERRLGQKRLPLPEFKPELDKPLRKVRGRLSEIDKIIATARATLT